MPAHTPRGNAVLAAPAAWGLAALGRADLIRRTADLDEDRLGRFVQALGLQGRIGAGGRNRHRGSRDWPGGGNEPPDPRRTRRAIPEKLEWLDCRLVHVRDGINVTIVLPFVHEMSPV